MILRSLAAVAIAIVAAIAAHRLVWLPHQCNVVKRQVGESVDRHWERRSTAAYLAGARNEPLLAKALEHCPHDVALLMLAGSNQVLMNRHTSARVFFERALQFGRRPDLHMAAGMSQLELGERKEALAHFLAAARFAGASVLADVPDAGVRGQAYRIIGERHERALALRGKLDTRNLLENSDFSRPGESRSTQVERRGASPSAAAVWQILNERGTVSTSLVPSPRRPGGNALHVVATRGGSGIRQAWSRQNRRPAARTTAMVFVHRGRVCIGTGSGTLMQNACTTTTGRWERLEGISESCPARITTLTAATANGADFVVDEISARLAVGIPCER
jgi:hypothetical protein